MWFHHYIKFIILSIRSLKGQSLAFQKNREINNLSKIKHIRNYWRDCHFWGAVGQKVVLIWQLMLILGAKIGSYWCFGVKHFILNSIRGKKQPLWWGPPPLFCLMLRNTSMWIFEITGKFVHSRGILDFFLLNILTYTF